MSTSTPTSRRLVVDQPQVIPFVYVRGEFPFPVVPAPLHARRGVYRAELDLASHTATVSLIALAPEEASHE